MENQKTIIPKNMINYQSLPGKAADFIREQIIQGNFVQGSRLVEEDISDSLGVSRACVREALMSLELEGLVKRIRNKYTEIVKFDRKDIEDVFLLRIALELLCVETCINKKAIPVMELKHQLNEMQKAATLDEKNYMKRVEEDFRFHELIINASQNTRAINFWKSLRSQMLTMFYVIPKRHSDFFDLNSANNHMKIINVLETGDIDVSTFLLKAHIMQTLQILNNEKI